MVPELPVLEDSASAPKTLATFIAEKPQLTLLRRKKLSVLHCETADPFSLPSLQLLAP